MKQKQLQAIANVMAQALVGAIDAGEKDDGGWDALFRNGMRPYLRGRKDDLITGSPDAKYAHGPGGIFSVAGLENMVINLHMMPQDLDALIPALPTVYMNPLYPFLTGFSEDSGDEPAGQCEDCLGGTIQGCITTATFGHVCRASDEINIRRTMQMLNRGETTPLTLIGEVLGGGGITRMPNTPGDWLELVTRSEMVKVGILQQRKLIRMTWNGDPIHNTANDGYREFPGMEMLVGTGKVDITGTTCPALDSLVMDFNFMNVEDADAGGNDIVAYISQGEYYVRHVGIGTGMMPARWVLCMRPELWYEVSALWPCRYNTNRCGNPGNSQVAVTLLGDQMTRERDAMRSGLYIDINGRRYDVVLCDGMTELCGDPAKACWNAHVKSGEYASDIFFMPLTVRGGMNVLYWEYLDYSKSDTEIALTKSGNDFWTDGGRWLWTVERKRGCYKMFAEIDPRIVLRTPQLAFRLDNILYTPMKHLRSPFPDSPYFLKGGVSTRDDPSADWSSEWNARQ